MLHSSKFTKQEDGWLVVILKLTAARVDALPKPLLTAVGTPICSG